MNLDPLAAAGQPTHRPSSAPTLVLRNANVITLQPGWPYGEQVAVTGDVISWVGGATGGQTPAGAGTRVIDCGGRTVLPAFNDAHMHLLSLAATFWSVNCGPGQVTSILDIQRLILDRARKTRAGEWVRAFGYDESALEERRHPNRADLDAAAPDVPVRLIHRSGHASVLNTAGLGRAGLRAETPDPDIGYMDRDPLTGRPTGFVVDMEEHISKAVPRPSYEQVQGGIKQASERLVSRGIGSIQDATIKNDIERWNLFQRLKADGSFQPNMTFMPGINHVAAFHQQGLLFGTQRQGVRIGHAKIVAALDNGYVRPTGEDLRILVAAARQAGFPTAIHAVEAEVVEAALRALMDTRSGEGLGAPRDRIEHGSELPEALIQLLWRSDIQMVTQPSFLYFNGDRYLADVAPERRPWLYRGSSLIAGGIVPPAAGSDAPVAPANPLRGIHAAVNRRSLKGAWISPEEGVRPRWAVEMHTRYPAFAAHEERIRGTIAPGKAADLVILDRNPIDCPPEEIADIPVFMTIVGGQVVWE